MIQSKKFGLPVALGVTLALALSGCSNGGGNEAVPEENTDGSSQNFAGQTLTIAAYSGAWADAFTEAFIKPFEADTGAKVEMVAGAPAEWLTQLRSTKGSTPAYDLVGFSANVIPQAVAASVIKPLETDRIEHFDELSTVLAEQTNYDGGQYGMPLTLGVTGYAFRSDRVQNAPEKWADILDDEFCGYVAMSPMTFNIGIEFLAGFIQEQGGDITNEADVEAAFGELEKLANCTSAYPSDGPSIESALQNGDAHIAAYWDGRAFIAQNNGEPFDFTYPAGGATPSLVSVTMTEGTKNEDLAYAFLGYIANSEYQPTFSHGTWYATSNNNNVYSDEFSAQIQYGDEVFSNYTWIDWGTVTPRISAMQERWQEIFGR